MHREIKLKYNSYDRNTSIAQYSVRCRMNLFGCCYLYLMFTNCLCQHARTRACAGAAPAPTTMPTRSVPGILFEC